MQIDAAVYLGGNMSNIIQEIIKADKPTAFATLNGKDVYSFYDANLVNQQEIAEEKLTDRTFDLGGRDFKPSGLGVRHIRCNTVAMNPNTWFANRVRKIEILDENGKVKETQFEVVTDYRAIKEQNRGSIYCSHLPCWVIGKHTNGGVTVKESKTITDEDFIKNFTDEFELEDAIKVAKAIERFQNKYGAKKLKLEF